MSRRQLQSLVGCLIHVAKCVAPARLFISRILEALRGAPKYNIILTDPIKDDMNWLLEFCQHWNGIAIIPTEHPSRDIYVDTSLTGFGAQDGTRAYTKQIGGDNQIARNIAELEAINLAIALHSFMDESYVGTHICVFCDNPAGPTLCYNS